MPDLVHGLLLRARELPVADGLLLEEVPDLVAAREEVVVPDVVVVARRELRLSAEHMSDTSGARGTEAAHERVVREAEVREELLCAREQRRGVRRAQEGRQPQVAGASEAA